MAGQDYESQMKRQGFGAAIVSTPIVERFRCSDFVKRQRPSWSGFAAVISLSVNAHRGVILLSISARGFAGKPFGLNSPSLRGPTTSVYFGLQSMVVGRGKPFCGTQPPTGPKSEGKHQS